MAEEAGYRNAQLDPSASRPELLNYIDGLRTRLEEEVMQECR